MARTVTAAIIIIGDEILSGRTQDTNFRTISQFLGPLGVEVREGRVIPDIHQVIIDTVKEMSAAYDYVFTTGGIGPTHDDITSGCVAKAFGVALERHPEAVARLERHYPPGSLNEARLRMAEIPVGGTLIDNPVSTAPGFRIGNVHVMAGVPRIMQAMFEGIAHTLVGGKPALSRSVSCTLGEGILAKGLGEIQARHPSFDIGSYPYYRVGGFGVSLVARGTDAGELDVIAKEIAEMIKGLGGTPVFDATT